MTGRGISLDVWYLRSLGPAAFPAIDAFLASPANSANPAVPDIAGWRADDEYWYRGDMQPVACLVVSRLAADALSRRAPAIATPRSAGHTIVLRRGVGLSGPGDTEQQMPHRILVADDDPHIREVICFALEKAGMATAAVADGAAALRAFERRTPELVVLDVGMPEMDGLEVCRLLRAHLRRADPVPVGARRGDRPHPRARDGRRRLRHQAVQPARAGRPRQRHPAARARGAGGRWRRGSRSRMAGFSSIRRSRAVGFGERQLALTAIEFAILKRLMARPAHVLSRSQLMDASHAANIHVSDRTIDSHVRNIRAKLAAAGCADAIETVHGVGFRLGRCGA